MTRKNIKNEKVFCMHCQAHIANKHIASTNNFNDYKDQSILVPTKLASITKTKIRGVSFSENYGDMETTIGFTLEIQLKCSKCEFHTTTVIQNNTTQ